MTRTASTPLQALAIPAAAATLLLVLVGFTGGADAPAEHLQISDASSSRQP